MFYLKVLLDEKGGRREAENPNLDTKFGGEIIETVERSRCIHFPTPVV